MVAGAIGFADEIAQGRAAGDVIGNVAENGETHLVILQLLEEVPGQPGAEIEELGGEAARRHDDYLGFGAIGLAQEVERILLAAEGGPFGSDKKQDMAIDRFGAHTDVPFGFSPQADTRNRPGGKGKRDRMRIAICLAALLALGGPALAQPFHHSSGEWREYHRDWLAACPDVID